MGVTVKSPAKYALTAFFGLQVVLSVSSAALSLPWFTYQPPNWRALLMYGCGATYIGYLCWQQSPRARFAAYVFLSVDIVRALRGSHWLTVVLDLLVLSFMQLPSTRASYPSIRPRHRRVLRDRQPPSAIPVNSSPQAREP